MGTERTCIVAETPIKCKEFLLGAFEMSERTVLCIYNVYWFVIHRASFCEKGEKASVAYRVLTLFNGRNCIIPNVE